MPHIDPDLLALIALGDAEASEADLRHLADCAECAQTLRELTEAAELGRASAGIGILVKPDPRVWDAISIEVSSGPTGETTGASRPRSRFPRWAIAAVAAVVAVGVVAAVVFGWNALTPTPSKQIASAALAPLPAWAGAFGSAVVRRLPDGKRQVVIHLEVGSTGPDYREAWFMTSDLKHLVPIGVIHGTEATFAVPASVDLKDYDGIDVSAEPHDGNPGHSGNSIVRGELRAGRA